MGGARINNAVVNQGGSPMLLTGTFAQRPAAGIQGRKYFATDTLQIFEDTGATWNDYETGNVSGSGTAGQLVKFVTATTIGDSIVREVGSTISVSGSISLASNLNVGGGTVLNTTTTGDKILRIGDMPSDDSSVLFDLLSSNTAYNWRIATNNNVAGAFEILPSTVPGGNLFGATALSLDNAGNMILNGNASVRFGYRLIDAGTSYGGLYLYKTILGSGTDRSQTIFAETGLGFNVCVNGDPTVKVYRITSAGNNVWTGSGEFGSSIKTAAPAGGGTADVWKLGNLVNAAPAATDAYFYLDIGGVTVTVPCTYPI